MLSWLIGWSPVTVADLGEVHVTRQHLRDSSAYLGAPWEAVRVLPAAEVASRAAEQAAIRADRERRLMEIEIREAMANESVRMFRRRRA